MKIAIIVIFSLLGYLGYINDISLVTLLLTATISSVIGLMLFGLYLVNQEQIHFLIFILKVWRKGRYLNPSWVGSKMVKIVAMPTPLLGLALTINGRNFIAYDPHMKHRLKKIVLEHEKGHIHYDHNSYQINRIKTVYNYLVKKNRLNRMEQLKLTLKLATSGMRPIIRHELAADRYMLERVSDKRALREFRKMLGIAGMKCKNDAYYFKLYQKRINQINQYL
jgi:hypothetical protein